MYPTTLLESWINGKWHEIGWRASNPEDAAALRVHGLRLAALGGRYRLVQPSIYAGHPPEVLETLTAEPTP